MRVGRVMRWGRAAVLVTAALSARVGLAQVDTAVGRVVDSAAARGFSGVVLVAGVATASPALAGTEMPVRDTVLYERAVGFADRAARRPLRVDAEWRWASVTKQVTAALVMQQVDAGRLALDSTVGRYLPWFTPAAGRTVTIRQLLQHTSGLPNPEQAPPDADGVPSFYRAHARAVGNEPAARGYCAGPMTRPPGGTFEYNNCDYLVLGAVLERVTGRDYAAIVRETLGPLGAPHVGVSTMRTVRSPSDSTAVVGYLDNGRPEPPIDLATYGAAGAVRGTPRDLLAFDRALLRHALVSPAATAEMWRGDPRLGYAALGAWAFSAPLRGCRGPVALIERRGAILGVQVRNILAPALGRVVIVFANDAGIEFGEIWQGAGLSYDLLSAAFCESSA